MTSFHTEHRFRDLKRWSNGCSRRDCEALPSQSHYMPLRYGIRSLVGNPTSKGTGNHPELYPHNYVQALPLKAFRGEPAITGFDKLITPTHRSSDDVALSNGSALHVSFETLQPVHG